jgi:hypothetical protein
MEVIGISESEDDDVLEMSHQHLECHINNSIGHHINIWSTLESGRGDSSWSRQQQQQTADIQRVKTQIFATSLHHH